MNFCFCLKDQKFSRVVVYTITEEKYISAANTLAAAWNNNRKPCLYASYTNHETQIEQFKYESNAKSSLSYL